MQKFRFPLSSSTWNENEFQAIESVLRSDQLTMGEKVNNFEQDFSKFVGSKYSLMVNSGSSANLLMIAALFYTKNKDYKLKKGDEIIVPAVSWSTSYYPLYQYGLHIKFVDIDRNTLNYNLDELAEAITPNTKALLAVNLLGNPNNFNQIMSLIEGKDIILLEDNCESMGASFKGKKTGTFGVMGTFSSYFAHHISTIEGGIIVTGDEELFQILLCLRSHGWTRSLPNSNLVTGVKDLNLFKESFNFVLPGYNVRPNEIAGCLGIEQLKKLNKFISLRRKNASYAKEKLKDHPIFQMQKEIGKSSWFGFSLVLRSSNEVLRKYFEKKLNELGFEIRPIVCGNFTRNPVIKYFDYSIHRDLKNADYIHDNGLYIGNHHYDIKEAIDTLCNIRY